ncbi:hypothetical protein OH805_16975 [Streptomyces sp. NBC_00879]|uniref:hypothetical protein n=1 Tax=Streptomyces sp. NBC_00879 TaxID=2975855 RepID=UPI003862FC46|nr:hypothetical protein OH805_16975 [Streptomyces sp. NBC_00879]
MDVRAGTGLLRDLPCKLVDDLRYDSLSVFVSQRFDKGLTDYRVRLPGVSGTGPVYCPLDLRHVGRHYRHCLVVLARVRGHGRS